MASARLFGALVGLATLVGCSHERIIGLEDQDSGSAADDAGRDAGEADAGTRDAGVTDAVDAGLRDAGPPFELERALRECEQLESCMLGPSNYNGLTFLNACIANLGQPVPDPAEYVTASSHRLLHLYLPPRDLNYLLWLRHPVVQTCIRSQTTCEGLLSCFNRGDAATTCGPGSSARCDGNVLTSCQAPSHTFKNTFGADGGFRTFSYDCGLDQRICATSTLAAGAAACTPASCSPGEQSRCDGNVARRCLGGLVDIIPCPDGFACTLRSSPLDAVCGGSGASCNVPASLSHCDGTRQVSCQFGGWATVDCPANLGCHTAPNGVGFCGVAGECDPSEALATCDAQRGVVRVCAMGRWMEVDCGALGFGGCIDATLDHPALCR